jgi:hypothetical protein
LEIQIKIELEKGGATASLKNFEGEVIKSGVAVGNLRKELGNFVVSSRRMSNSVNLTGKELRSLEKSVGGFKTATGGATSAAMELGRVVSDAPYGIRGMANNVSQLASQITYMASATDITTGKTVGFVGAIKGVGRALMGTTGVLLAIQAVIAAVDYFANRTDNATDSASDFESGIDDLVSTLDDLSISQSKVNDKILEYIQYRAFSLKSDEELKGVLEDLSDIEDDIASKRKKNANFELLFKEKSKGLTIEQYKALSEQEKAEVRRTAGIANLTQKIDDYGRSVNKVSELEDERVEAIKKAVGIRQSQNDAEDEFKSAEEGTLKALKDKLKELKKDREVLSKTSEDYKKLTVEIKKTEKAIEAIEGTKGKPKEKPKVKTLFDGLLGDFKETAVRSFERQMRDLELARLSGHISEEFFEETKASLKKEFESENIMKGIAPKLELGENAKKAIDDYNKKLLEDFAKRMRQEEMIEYGEALSENLSTISSFIDSEYERRLTTEQNYTNALNEQLNQRLLNENLSKEERASIQQEIWQNDEKLRKKQNEIKKKQFNSQKAFNIAKATIDTYTAATGVLKDTQGGSFARIAGMIAVIGSGLAQVAMIARQKFQPDAASTPIRTAGGGGGGGGVGDRSFNFNLVGANQQNQLVNAIQSQFDKPLKAYVVSKDITNQQQLDANTKSTARFGG